MHRSADEAKANAAEVLIEAGSTALANGHSFDAMHRFARAIGTCPASLISGIRQHWDSSSAKFLDSILELPEPISSASYSRDGSRVVTTSEGNQAQVWDVATGSILTVLKLPQSAKPDPRESGSLERQVARAGPERRDRLRAVQSGRHPNHYPLARRPNGGSGPSARICRSRCSRKPACNSPYSR